VIFYIGVGVILFSIFNLARLGVAMDTVPSHTLVIRVKLCVFGGAGATRRWL
jgi:hypothetical protein